MTEGRLRRLRQRRRMTMKDVEVRTAKIASRFSDKRHLVLRSQLSAYETQQSTPSIYKFFALLNVYRCRPSTLLKAFGIPGRPGGKAPMKATPTRWTRPTAPLVMSIGRQERGGRKP